MTRFACLMALLALPAAGQQPDPNRPQPDVTRHKVSLRGGSVLVGRLEPSQWRVTTEFGPLTIPVDEIRSIRFGRRADLARFKEVQRLVQLLADSNPDRRDYAHAALSGLGVYAAPELKRQAKDHSDPEVRRRAEELLKSIDVAEQDWPRDEDQIVTNRFSIIGSVGEDMLKVSVAELGLVTLQRKDVVEVQAYRPSAIHRAEVKGQNNVGFQWAKTGIKVSAGVTLRIHAEGQIHYPNWGNRIMVPEGNFNWGNWNGIAYGCLVGRIGDSGTFFKIGRHYVGRAQTGGELQLALAGQFGNNPSTGTYKVSVRLDETGSLFGD
ncbi:MAG: HEAT repeat domain-containing protein [Planctomycetota bacterium]